MGERVDNPDSLLTLPVVVGVLVVFGGIAALAVSGLFVYRAHRVNVETERMQASIQAEREHEALKPTVQDSQIDDIAEAVQPEDLWASADEVSVSDLSAPASALKPGIRLHAQRPAHWDQAEIVDILEGKMIKVRWLSGAPGEDVIAAELVRAEDPTPQ